MSGRVPLRLVIVGEIAWWLHRAYTAVMRCATTWRWR